MITPHRSTHVRSVRGIFLAGLLSFSVLTPVRSSLFEDHKQAIIGGAVGAGCALLAVVACKGMVNNERVEREQQHAQLKKRISALRSWLATLQDLYDKLPVAQFEQEADRKISAVRELLSADLAQYKGSLAQNMTELNEGLARLEKERSEMVRVLDKQRNHFDQARTFIRSVHDRDGASYLNDVVTAKREVEALVAELHEQRRILANDLNNLNDVAVSNAAELSRQQNNIRATEAAVDKLNDVVAQRRLQVDKAARASQDAVHEAENIRETVQRTQQETRTMKSELDVAVSALNQYLKTVQSDYNSLGSQVRNAKNLLLDVNTRIASLQDAVKQAGQSSSVTSYTTPSSSSSYDSSSRSSYQSSSPQESSTDSAVVQAAVQTLQRALQPFASGSLLSDSDYRRAYRKFALRNHPDRGGLTHVFQAVDGMYKLLDEKRLFNRTPSFIPAGVRSSLTTLTSDLEQAITSIQR